jgi:hypothetical protein
VFIYLGMTDKSKLLSWRNWEQIKLWDWMLQFISESFVSPYSL